MRLPVRERYTLHQPQRIHGKFQRQFRINDFTMPSDKASQVVAARQVGFGLAGLPAAFDSPPAGILDAGQLAMGTGPNAQIIAKTPVVEIMLRLSPGAGISGNLVA